MGKPESQGVQPASATQTAPSSFYRKIDVIPFLRTSSQPVWRTSPKNYHGNISKNTRTTTPTCLKCQSNEQKLTNPRFANDIILTDNNRTTNRMIQELDGKVARQQKPSQHNAQQRHYSHRKCQKVGLSQYVNHGNYEPEPPELNRRRQAA
uniref:Uncharacterized protein n=1 Tax=Caenorhabditis japonica TaxID=281687 RepID=A0A8R1ERG0_CAEJA